MRRCSGAITAGPALPREDLIFLSEAIGSGSAVIAAGSQYGQFGMVRYSGGSPFFGTQVSLSVSAPVEALVMGVPRPASRAHSMTSWSDTTLLS